MSSFLQPDKLNKKSFSNFFRICLNLALMLTIKVYVSIRLIFFEIRLPIGEELMVLIQVVFAAVIIGTFIFGFLLLIEWIDQRMKTIQINQTKLKASKLAAIVIVIGIVILSACGQFPKAGVKKDLSSGMTTSYKSIEPEKVMLVMNDEEIHHNDIPLGESFYVINHNVKGLVEKEGKVSVGCALTIADQKGNKILDEADLFQDKDVLNKDEVTYLRCKVNTGDPMKWEEKYDVQVTFWDKYGPGKIVNKITIRMIDVP